MNYIGHTFEGVNLAKRSINAIWPSIAVMGIKGFRSISADLGMEMIRHYTENGAKLRRERLVRANLAAFGFGR